MKFVPKGPINNIPALVQIMAWLRSSDKPLSELIMISLLTHIRVTRPQWVKDNITITKWASEEPDQIKWNGNVMFTNFPSIATPEGVKNTAY